ncbi:hypothetical protein [Thorsellia kenyensis]|uniref:Uncharacterized protein n=1 Tax=Thorsellia kenyensis TaxID=1549888 RepID=A0ABV6CA95_9GAMM
MSQKISSTSHEYYYKVNSEYGRIEERHVWMIDSIEWLKERHSVGKGINSIIIVQSIREMKNQPETKSEELRFYILSHKKRC